MQAPRYAAMKAKSDDQLVAEYDMIAEHTGWGTRDLLDELARRASERQTNVIRRLSWAIAGARGSFSPSSIPSTMRAPQPASRPIRSSLT